MNFKTNFGKIALLGNVPMYISFSNKKIEFVPPNIKLYLLDDDFAYFLYVVKITPEEFKNINNRFIVENKYETLMAVLKIDPNANTIVTNLQKVFPNLVYKKSSLMVEEEVVTAEEYEVLLKMLLISCAEQELETFMQEVQVAAKPKRELTASEKRALEVEEKLNRIKKTGKKREKEKQLDTKSKNDTASKGSTITIDQIIIAILYEFPSLNLEGVYNMSMFTLLVFWSYIQKVVDNQIMIVAAGSGNVKKFTYFIN